MKGGSEEDKREKGNQYGENGMKGGRKKTRERKGISKGRE